MTSLLSKTTLQKLLDLASLHCTTSERPGPSLHSMQLNFLSRPLDYCNARLAGHPSCTIKPLQMIRNAAARLVFSKPKSAHVTPHFISLHWLSVAARIKFKTLMLAYRTATGSAPSYFHSLITIYIPSRSLRASITSWCHHREAQNHSPERFYSPFLAGELPTAIRNAESMTIFKQHLKNHIFRHHLTCLKKIKNFTLFPYLCSLSLKLSLSG